MNSDSEDRRQIEQLKFLEKYEKKEADEMKEMMTEMMTRIQIMDGRRHQKFRNRAILRRGLPLPPPFWFSCFADYGWATRCTLGQPLSPHTTASSLTIR